MKEIETLKQLVYEKGLQTLLKRMEVVLSCRDLRTLTSNVIVSATIVDMDAVVRKIKEEWSVFEIKDVRVNLVSQTEKYNYLNEVKEEYAEEKALPLANFVNNGIEVEII